MKNQVSIGILTLCFLIQIICSEHDSSEIGTKKYEEDDFVWSSRKEKQNWCQ